ncbi:MAG: AAA family ATPase [Muribaculaceae bacterium]|nr:AAA family ATPase [Muribaculaceae bacterium]
MINCTLRKNVKNDNYSECHENRTKYIYLEKVAESRHNGMIKIITGVRRSGKSFLLFDLFAGWLEAEGVSADHIIKIDLENRRNQG